MTINQVGYKRIPIGNGKTTMVSPEDYPYLSKFTWRISQFGYARHSRRMPGKTVGIFMALAILWRPKGFHVDHINGNKLDNRRENLRICTQQQNSRNKKVQRNSKTGIKGVKYMHREKKYQARIMVNYKSISLGYFKTAKEAGRAYDVAALRYFGDFARLNHQTTKTSAPTAPRK